MELRGILAGLTALTWAVGFASNATAQSQAQADRVDQLARYIVTASLCEKLGFVLVPNAPDRISTAAMEEILASGMTEETANTIVQSAVNRHSRAFKHDLDAELVNHASDPAGLNAFFVEKGTTCVQAATDPLFSKFMPKPPDYNLGRAAQDAVDVLLAPGGLASWQTPAIQARGDLLMTAGTCREQIGSVRVDAIYNTYAKSNDPRERAYYQRAYDEGLADTEMGLDKIQCERAIAGFKKSAGAVK